jgi:hypothetical protein
MSELCSAAIILSVVNVKEGSLSLIQKWKRPIWSLILFNLRMYLMLFFRHNSPIGSVHARVNSTGIAPVFHTTRTWMKIAEQLEFYRRWNLSD